MQTKPDEPTQAMALTQQMLASTSAENVFGKTVQHGDTMVMTASEVVAAMGVGRIGAAGGGGGTSDGRPVAVISIDPHGEVDVKPIVDVTKIALAFFTALSSFLVMLSKARKN